MKMQHLQCSWALSNDSKHNEASFSTSPTHLLYLRVSQMSRCSDLAIFVLTDGQTDRTDYTTPCACVRGNNYIFVILKHNLLQKLYKQTIKHTYAVEPAFIISSITAALIATRCVGTLLFTQVCFF